LHVTFPYVTILFEKDPRQTIKLYLFLFMRKFYGRVFSNHTRRRDLRWQIEHWYAKIAARNSLSLKVNRNYLKKKDFKMIRFDALLAENQGSSREILSEEIMRTDWS
jgi:hypothetical protein